MMGMSLLSVTLGSRDITGDVNLDLLVKVVSASFLYSIFTLFHFLNCQEQVTKFSLQGQPAVLMVIFLYLSFFLQLVFSILLSGWFVPSLFLCLFSYLYWYGRMSLYLILWVITQHYHYVAQIALIWQLETQLLSPFAFWHSWMCQVLLQFFFSSSRISHFSKEPRFLLVENGI